MTLKMLSGSQVVKYYYLFNKSQYYAKNIFFNEITADTTDSWGGVWLLHKADRSMIMTVHDYEGRLAV